MINIYLNTWKNYNENGADGGEWLTLPMDHDELLEEMKKISDAMHDYDPEYFINDYENLTDAEIEVGEYTNILELNETLQEIDGLDEYESKVLAALLEVGYYSDLKEALENVNDYGLYEGYDLEDLAYELVEDCYNLPKFALRYFDYKAFARDLSFDGYDETSVGVLYQQ